jgi:hypothetical protein
MSTYVVRKKKVARLTIADVRARVDKLSQMAGSKDYEAADAEEHQIWGEVLENIRKGHPQAKGLAAEALTTKFLTFPRGWGS